MAETKKFGYYTQDTGQNVYHFFMGAEPPEEQYILRERKWQRLEDGYYLMDLIMDGNPELEGPFPEPPEGVPTDRSDVPFPLLSL